MFMCMYVRVPAAEAAGSGEPPGCCVYVQSVVYNYVMIIFTHAPASMCGLNLPVM